MKDIVNRRFNIVRMMLREKNLDAILLANFCSWGPGFSLTYDYDIYYLSNLLRRFDNCLLIITEEKHSVWVETWDLKRAKEQSWLDEIQPINMYFMSAEDFASVASRYVKKMTGKEKLKIGVNGRCLASSVALGLVDEGLSVADVSSDLEKARFVKDEVEIPLLRKAAEIADAGVEAVMDSVRKGITEVELAALAEYEMKKRGAGSFWFPSFVSGGPHSCSINGADSPDNRKIVEGDIVTMDFTPVYEGYSADIARTFIYGTPTGEQLAVFNLAKQAYDGAVSALKIGARIGDVVEAAARPVKGTPYEQFYSGPGHGIGLYDDVYPFMRPPNLNLEITEDMALSVEVAFLMPGFGAMRLEDNYLIVSSGAERLTRARMPPSIPVSGR